MRPLGLDEGSLHSNVLYPSLHFFLLLLVGWFKTRAACDWEHQLRGRRCYSLVVLRSHRRNTMELSSPEVGANVGPCSQML
jgi:hypothetical protein